MRIVNIRYEQTKNLGNYESQKLAAEAVIEEEENADAALTEMMYFVQHGLGIVPTRIATGKPKAEQINDDIFGPKDAEDMFHDWIRLAEALKLGPKAQEKFHDRHSTEVSRMATEDPGKLGAIIEKMEAEVQKRQQQEATA